MKKNNNCVLKNAEAYCDIGLAFKSPISEHDFAIS
jgi:hypothetical protein